MQTLARVSLAAVVGLAAFAAACGSGSPAPSNSAQLGALAVSAGALSPAFSGAVLQYGLAVPNGTASVVISPTAADPAVRSITISQDGGAAAAVASGGASPALPTPAVGTTSRLAIVVTAQDGAATVTYAIALTQDAAPASNDATLAALTLSAGSLAPGFAASVTSYAVALPNGTTSITVTPQAHGSAATITVAQDGGAAAPVASGSASASLVAPAVGATSTVAIVVTAQDRSTRVTYQLQLTQGASNDATLASLAVSAGSLSPAFAPGVTSYAVTVPNGTASFTVTPGADSSAAASIEIAQDGSSPVLVESGSASAALAAPAVGATSTISIVVTAQDGTTRATYQLAVAQAPSSDAALASLAVSAGALSPAFAPEVLTYSLVVPGGTSSITVTPEAHGSEALSITVAQDGGAPATVESGSASAPLAAPAFGATSTISIVVTAQDGTARSTYQVAVTQGPGSDATLSALAVSAGSLSPAFSPSVTSYSLAAPSGTASITVTPTQHDSHAASITLAVNGGTPAPLASGSASAAIAVPASGVTSTLVLVVTAQDGITQDTYSIALTQAPSSDATLASLATSAGALSPAFAPGTTAYSLITPNGTASITVTPTAHASKITSITAALNGGAAAVVASGSASSALAVPAVGSTSTIAIVVTAQDGATKATYSIALTQAPSADATLAALAVSAGALSPGFAAATSSYSLVVPNGTASITVTPTAHASKVSAITVSLNGGAAAAVSSGSASSPLAVPAVGGTSTIAISVTAQDGATKGTYSILVAQAALADAALSSLVPSAGALSPVFAAGTFSYSLSVPNGTAALTLTPSAHAAAISSITVKQDAGAAVTVASGSASSALTVPATGATSTITVVVTAQDGATKDTYAIALTQQPLVSTDAALGNLAVTAGALSPAFASGTTAYTLALPYGTSALSVTPTARATAISSIKIAQDSGTAQTVASGATSALIVPAPGSTSTVSISVTAQDGSTKATYTLSITQAAPSHDAALASLVASAGTLSPAFVAGTTAYALSLPNGTAALTFTATQDDPLARSIALAQDASAAVALTSGQPSPSLAVPAPGATSNVTIAVTAQDGTTRVTYAIAITQKASTSSVWFKDDFESGNLNNWTLTPGGGTTPGSFSVAVDPLNANNHVMQYTAGNLAAPAAPAATNGAGWVIAMLQSAVQSALPSQSSYYLEARIRAYANSTTGNKQIYLVGHYQDVADLYGGGLNFQSATTSTAVELSSEIAGVIKKLISVKTPLVMGTSASSADGQWYDVRADFKTNTATSPATNTLTIYLNGVAIGTTTDTSFASGPIGLFTANKSFQLDDFKVGDPTLPPPQLSLSPSASTYAAVAGAAATTVNVAAIQPDGVTADTFTAASSAPGVVSVSTSGSTVTLTPVAAGTATISFVDGTDPDLVLTIAATITAM